MKQLILLGLALTLASAAFAFPTFSGLTGGAVLPTSDVAYAGQLEVAGDWVNTDAAFTPLRAVYGLNDQFEVAFGYGFGDTKVGAFTSLFEGGNTFTGRQYYYDAVHGDIANDNTWNIGAKWMTPFTLGDATWSVYATYANTSVKPTNVKEDYLEFVLDNSSGDVSATSSPRRSVLSAPKNSSRMPSH